MSEYYAIERSDEYLEHYGIKGMKWGVRKAIESGNARKLRRQFKKASKKLAKLEKRGANGKKYAKRAAAYGAGAAAAGGLAALGTGGVYHVMREGRKVAGNATQGIGNAMVGLSKSKLIPRGMRKNLRTGGWAAQEASRKMKSNHNVVAQAGRQLSAWGGEKTIGNTLEKAAKSGISAASNSNIGRRTYQVANDALRAGGHGGIGHQVNKLGNVSNNTYARIGAGALGAGLGIAAGRNAYKAATAKRNRAKAVQFRNEMKKAFAGTEYADLNPRHGKKRRR